MKNVRLFIQVLFILFLIICIAVHIVGLTTRFNDEPVWSHIVHLVSYCTCLYVLVRPGLPYRWLVYLVASAYPFYYHGRCALNSYWGQGRLNPVCILVVVLMPVIGLWIWKTTTKKST